MNDILEPGENASDDPVVPGDINKFEPAQAASGETGQKSDNAARNLAASNQTRALQIAAPQAEAAHSRHFIINESTDFSGPSNSDGSLCETADSSYKLNDKSIFGEFYRFHVTIDGETRPLYCMEKGTLGPFEYELYQSGPPSEILANHTERQRNMVAWLVANAYPSISDAETFALAGVDASIAPQLI